MTEVFITGPTRSGKTVFGIGLYEHLSGEARLKNKVISLNTNTPTLDELYLYMKKYCEYPKATETDELRIYVFERSSFLHGNITIEFLDYRGEFIPIIAKSLRNFDDFLTDIERYVEEDYIEKIKTKTLNFEDLKKLSKEVSTKTFIEIAKFYLICRSLMSNKMMLLIDGEKLVNYILDRDVNIIEDLIRYTNIVNYIIEETKKSEIYPEKEIALVVTKADLLDEVFERDTGKNRIENYKKFMNWIDEYLSKSDKRIPAYNELKKNTDKFFATSVKIIKSEKRIVTFGFDRVKNWLESSSLIGGRIL